MPTLTHRSKKVLTYHGRSGHPVVHQHISKSRSGDTRTFGNPFIMVRAVGGGTKRLYLTKSGDVPKHLRKKVKHRR